MNVRPTRTLPGQVRPMTTKRAKANQCDSPTNNPNYEIRDTAKERQKIDLRPNLSAILGTNSKARITPLSMATLKQ